MLLGLSIIILSCYNPVVAFAIFFYFLLVNHLANLKIILTLNFILGVVFMIFGIMNFNLYAIFLLPGQYVYMINHMGLAQGVVHIFMRLTSQFGNYFIGNGLSSIVGMWMIFLTLIEINTMHKRKKQRILQPSVMNKAISDNVIDLGNEIRNSDKVCISDYELNHHCLVLGTTGSGKTTTLMNIVESCCQRGFPLVYLDGKGNLDLVKRIKKFCDKYQRTLKVFALDANANIPNLSGYNPLAFGDFSEWKNKVATLMGDASGRGQEHYKITEQNYINLVCEVLNKSGKYIDLEGVLAYIKTPNMLLNLANQISPELSRRVSDLQQNNKSQNNDIIKILEMFYHSQYGKLLSTSNMEQNQVINLRQNVLDGEIILFLFDAASYKTDTSLLGKLVINDINSVWSSFGREGVTIPGYCVFDEFASYAASNLSNILSLQRANGLHAVIGTQSVSAISVDNIGLRRIAKELIANCNTYIIHRLNDPEDILLLQNTIGLGVKQHTTQHYHANGEISVSISNREDFILPAEDVRHLPPGQAYICQKTGKPQLRKVRIRDSRMQGSQII